MRLLNIHTQRFKDFAQHEAPPYAIASHRWCADECTYQDILVQRDNHSEGYQKVKGYCQAVRSMNAKVQHSVAWEALGFKLKCSWLWLDTACIDKTNSAELSESINSMFQWYRKASVCYAYLSDVRSARDHQGAMLDLMRSEWFTRGWTLQELLAPGVVVFLTKDWTVLGHKCPYDKPLCEVVCLGFGQRMDFLLSCITKIPLGVIRNYTNATTITIEDRMSWIERRFTTRPEDRAYCMLGICGVFMSPIYGEGAHAWKRLLATIERSRVEEEITSGAWAEEEITLGARASNTSQATTTWPTRFLTAPGQRARQQVMWDTTVYVQVTPRSKTNAAAERQQQRASHPQSPNHYVVALEPSALGPTLEPQALGQWMQPHFLSQRATIQCGYCHGNIYTGTPLRCGNVLCKSPLFHKRCADSGQSETSFICRQCQSIMKPCAPEPEARPVGCRIMETRAPGPEASDKLFYWTSDRYLPIATRPTTLTIDTSPHSRTDATSAKNDCRMDALKRTPSPASSATEKSPSSLHDSLSPSDIATPDTERSSTSSTTELTQPIRMNAITQVKAPKHKTWPKHRIRKIWTLVHGKMIT